MSTLEIKLDEQSASFLPESSVSGRVKWQLDQTPEVAEIKLFWHTKGKGTVDIKIIETITINSNQQSAEHPFRFSLPKAPYSFSGKLISLIWAIELILEPEGNSTMIELVVAPDKTEIDLYNLRESGKTRFG